MKTIVAYLSLENLLMICTQGAEVAHLSDVLVLL